MADVRQISVFINNKPNQLNEAVRHLKETGINIRAMSLADTKDFGILRIVVNDTQKACDVLKNSGYAVIITDVIAVSVPDTAGQLSRILEILGSQEVNVEYLYAFLGTSEKSVSFVIRVDDNTKASAALNDAGIIQLTENDIAEM